MSMLEHSWVFKLVAEYIPRNSFSVDMSSKIRNKKIAGSYRVKQPINNFQLRVKISQQRPLLAELIENEGDTGDSNFLQEEERIFNWQEKVFSPSEVNFYNDETNCLNEYQKLYYRQIKEKNIQGSQLYTYTKNDSFYSQNELFTKPYKSQLAIRNETALPAWLNRKPFPERYNRTVIDDAPNKTRTRTNHYLYMDRCTMYVMVDLSPRDKILTSSDEDAETVLCIVTYNGLQQILSINPDFTNDDCYTITNSSGIQFNYWIEHASAKQSSLELHEQQNELKREIKEKLMHQEAELFAGFQLAALGMHKFFVKLDILSAHDFSYNGLYISYQLDLPENWSTNEKERLFGKTQRCNLMHNAAHFSYATEVSLEFRLTSTSVAQNVLPPWPRLLLSVSSLDKWFRHRTEGYAAIPLPALPDFYKFNIPTWQPTGSIINSLRRFFTGGTYELEDITFCSIPNGFDNKMLDKSQLTITPSGYIKLTMNIIHQTPSSIKGNDQLNFHRLSTDKFMDNIDNIFEQFKAARERMLQIRNLKI